MNRYAENGVLQSKNKEFAITLYIELAQVGMMHNARRRADHVRVQFRGLLAIRVR